MQVQAYYAVATIDSSQGIYISSGFAYYESIVSISLISTDCSVNCCVVNRVYMQIQAYYTVATIDSSQGIYISSDFAYCESIVTVSLICTDCSVDCCVVNRVDCQIQGYYAVTSILSCVCVGRCGGT